MISAAKVMAALKPHRDSIGTCVGISRLGQGENNEVFLAETDTGKFVVRISLKSELDKNMRREFLFLQGLNVPAAPRAFVFDKSKKILPYVFEVLSYSEGEKTMNWTNKRLSSFAKAVAELHASKKVSGCGYHARKKNFSLVEELGRWMRFYHEELQDSTLAHIYESVKQHLRERQSLIDDIPFFTIVHGDTCADNILFHKGEVSLIDWEWCSYGDPAQDIARLFFLGGEIAPWYLGLSREKVLFMVSEYQKYRRDKSLFDRVLLWHEVTAFGDMVFFRWKVNNYDAKTAALPKSHYRSVYNEMFTYFKKRYG